MKRGDIRSDWHGIKVLMVGVGLHGGAAATMRWVLRHGAVLRATDIKSAAELAPTVRQFKGRKVQWRLGGHRLSDFRWADVILQNQGVPDTVPEIRWARTRGIPIYNETSLFFSRCSCPIVGITGTRGKTTTATLVYEMLRRTRRGVVLSGNVRQKAMLDCLDALRRDSLIVLELSSFQLEYLKSVRRSPDVAVMTNLKIDHLNRYRSMNEYADAKYEIFRYQRASDHAILFADDPRTRAAARLTKASVRWWSAKKRYGSAGVSIRNGWIVEYRGRTEKRIAPLSAWKVPGAHQLENLLGAVAAARAAGAAPPAIAAAMKAFRGVPHRQEIVRRWKSRTFVNDTTATTPDGTLAAMAVFPKAVFILGGTDKKLEFHELVSAVAKRRQPVVFLPGSGTDRIVRGLRRRGFTRWTAADSMDDAVRTAAATAEPGQAVVLSPGAASFGLFVHEFDRGDAFVKAVRRLR